MANAPAVTDQIEDYHIHVYYDATTKPKAEALRAKLEAAFPSASYGRWHDKPVGPHPEWSYQVHFPVELFAQIVPFVALERDPPPGHWWREYGMRYMFVFLSLGFLYSALVSLMAPAKVTTACQELGEAINDLTATEGPGGEDDVKMASQEELLRIERLHGYVKGLNRGQGMGFTLKRKRITYTYV